MNQTVKNIFSRATMVAILTSSAGVFSMDAQAVEPPENQVQSPYSEVDTKRAVSLTAENTRKEVMEYKKPVVIDFYANWCGPCKTMAPIIDQLAKTWSNGKMVKVDIDQIHNQSPLIQKLYKENVRAYPTFLIYNPVKNQVLGVFEGAVDKNNFQLWIDNTIQKHNSKPLPKTAPGM